jgi:hypothetical protein
LLCGGNIAKINLNRHRKSLYPEGQMAEIGVAHLVRARNGIEPFRKFLESYAKHRGQTSHDLLLIYKGFQGRDAVREYRELLKPFPHREFFIRDLGYDLRSYSLAAQHFDYPHLCFLNSNSVILDDRWLERLSAPFARPDVGLVSATGSYESMYSNLLLVPPSENSFSQAVRRAIRLRVNPFFFRPFPNPHVRTNTFILPRKLMLEVWHTPIFTKPSAYLLENGRNNLTQRVLRRNLKVLVVGRDGREYEKETWWQSNTFRQSNQENLLVADNKTREYAQANFETRKILSLISWNEHAHPAQP